MILRLVHWISRRGGVQQSTFGTIIDKWEFYFYNPALFFLINQLLIIDKGLIIPFPAGSKSEREKQVLHINVYAEARKIVQMNLFPGQE